MKWASRIFCCYAFFAAPLFPQATTSLRGTLTDPSGAVIPEAIISITDAQTGTSRRGISDASGEYQFLQVPPGTYRLVAVKPGFATITRADVKAT